MRLIQKKTPKNKTKSEAMWRRVCISETGEPDTKRKGIMGLIQIYAQDIINPLNFHSKLGLLGNVHSLGS